MPGQALDAGRVIERHRERQGAGAQQRRSEILGRVELAQRALDGDFPDDRGAEQDLVSVVGELARGIGPNARVVLQPPKRGVGIQ